MVDLVHHLVPPGDPRAHARVVERGQEADERQEEHDGRKDQESPALDGHGDPEGEVALQERRSLPEVAPGHLVER